MQNDNWKRHNYTQTHKHTQLYNKQMKTIRIYYPLQYFLRVKRSIYWLQFRTCNVKLRSIGDLVLQKSALVEIEIRAFTYQLLHKMNTLVEAIHIRIAEHWFGFDFMFLIVCVRSSIDYTLSIVLMIVCAHTHMQQILQFTEMKSCHDLSLYTMFIDHWSLLCLIVWFYFAFNSVEQNAHKTRLHCNAFWPMPNDYFEKIVNFVFHDNISIGRSLIWRNGKRCCSRIAMIQN